MSDLSDAVTSLNNAADRATATTEFFDTVTTGGDTETVTNPNNNKTVPTVQKQVKDLVDENITVVTDAAESAEADAESAAASATEAEEFSISANNSASEISGLITWPSDSSAAAQVGDVLSDNYNSLRGTDTGSIYTTSEFVTGEITAIDFTALSATIGGVSVSLSLYSSDKRKIECASVSDMIEGRTISGVVVERKEGQVWSTGGTTWSVLADGASSLSDFSPVTNVYAVDFGVVADGETDDTTSLQSASDYVRDLDFSPALLLPAGEIKVTDEWDIALPAGKNMTIRGDSFFETAIVCHFNGFDKAVLQCSSITERGNAPTLENVRVEWDSVDSTQNPVGLDLRGTSNFRHKNLSFASSDNIQVYASTIYNAECDNLICYYGGHNYIHKDTDGVLFSITSGSNTLTSDTAIFDSNDVGKAISVGIEGNNQELYLIIAYTDTQTVSVESMSSGGTSVNTLTDLSGVFDGGKFSITSGSTTLTATQGATPFVEEDVGRTICVQYAKENNSILVAKIASYNSSSSVELDTEADITVGSAYATTPAVLFSRDDTYGGNTNDFVWGNVQIENPKGVGLVCTGQSRLRMPSLKIHAEAQPTSTQSTLSNWWIDFSSGWADGVIEGNPISTQAKISFSNGLGMFSLGNMEAVLINGERLFFEQNSGDDGLLNVGSVNIISSISSANSLPYIVKNESDADPRITINGPVSANTLEDGTYRVWWSQINPNRWGLTKDGWLGLGTDDPQAPLHIYRQENAKARIEDDLGGYWDIELANSGDLVLSLNGIQKYRFPTTGETNTYVASSTKSTGGSGSAGAGNQYVELEINGVIYKVLHDGTV